MFKSIRWRLALSFAGIALVAAVVLGAVLLTTLQNYYSSLELDYMRGNAKFVGGFVVAAQSDHAPHDEVQSQIENLSFLTQTRIQVYDANQHLLYDSGSAQKVNVNLAVMKQLIAQSNGVLPDATFRIIAVNPNSAAAPLPEAKEFFTFGSAPPPSGHVSVQPVPVTKDKGVVVYRSIRAVGSPFGFDLNAEAAPGDARSNLTVTLPLGDPQNGPQTGSVRLSEGPAYGSDILTSVARGWILASVIAVLLAAAVGWYISRRISAPVLALTAATTRMAQGDLTSRAGINGQDEFGQLARAFNEMANQVEGTVTALRRFAADAAHELNTPLTALRSDLDLASTEEQPRRLIERAQTNVKRLEVLNRNLLDLSRLEALHEKRQAAPVDLVPMVRQLTEVYASQAEQADIAFDVDLPDEPLVVSADGRQIQRAVGNLIENALKFTPRLGSVHVTVSRDQGTTCVSVADTGIGVPPDDLPQLFNRFHRGRNATAYAGSGLGLAIVKAIADQNGAQVVAENLTPGARFTLRWEQPSA